MADYENYKIVDAEKLDSALHSLAQSIREQSGVEGDLAFPEPNGFKEAVDSIQKGIIPTGTISITKNDTYNVTDFAEALVNVQPSSDYIKKSDTKIYATQFACGIYRPSSTITTSKISITVGFKPKMFYMRNIEGINNTSENYYVSVMWMMLDNNYSYIMCMPNGVDEMRTGGPVGVYYQSSAARVTWSNGVKHCLTATENGVAGNSEGTSFYCQSRKGFQWFAWG